MPGEAILHFDVIRLRITGSGNFKMTLLSLDSVKSQNLANLVLSSTNSIEPHKLCNFTQQRAFLQGKTTEIDETFKISKIIIFARPVATMYPG